MIDSIGKWLISNFLVFDIGFLFGMLFTAWFISRKGCYEECLLADKPEPVQEADDNSCEYWRKVLGRRKEDRE